MLFPCTCGELNLASNAKVRTGIISLPPGLHIKKFTDYARNCPRHHMPYFLLSEAQAGSAAEFRSQNWFISCSTILLMSTPVQYLARTDVMSCASLSSRRLAECQNTHADDRRHCVHHPRVQFGSKELGYRQKSFPGGQYFNLYCYEQSLLRS